MVLEPNATSPRTPYPKTYHLGHFKAVDTLQLVVQQAVQQAVQLVVPVFHANRLR